MKRNDLQGLRGLAIGAVLLFHFFPKISPNGYVGVDQFFVLSGFLMMMIFGSKEITGSSCYLFYYRRIKRIVPLYLFIILIVVALLFFIFPNTFFSVNVESGFFAIMFYTNMAKKSEGNAYFIALDQADDLFTHTWSLGVEMQFYLFAPIIFFLLHLTYRIDSIVTVLYLGLIGGASLVYHLMADSFNSFNNVFCRIWQFEIGIISYTLSVQLNDIYNKPKPSKDDKEMLLKNIEIEDDTDDEDVCSVLVRDRALPSKTPAIILLCIGLILMVFMAFCPITLPPTLIRIVTTFVSGLVIVFGTVVQEKNPLGNRILVYLGDISYAVYLIHWPVYVYIKFNYPGEYKMYCLGIAISLVMAILISETFEKWYLTLGGTAIIGMMALFYVFIITILLNREPIESFVDHLSGDDEVVIPHGGLLHSDNMTLEEAIHLNWVFDKDEYKNLVIPNCYPKQEHDLCRFNSSELKGKLNIFILGNSYAPNQGKVVYDTFGKYAKNMSKYSNSYCEVLIAERPKCTTSVYKRYLQITAKIKPDVLFMIARQIVSAHTIVGTVETDPLFLEAVTNLQKYEQMVTKKIYILDAMPVVTSKHIRKLNAYLTGRTNETENKEITNDQLEVRQYYKRAHTRLKALVKHCTKCELYNLNSVLENSKGEPQVYDTTTKLSYYTSGVHLTPAGLEAIKPIYQKMSKKFEKTYKSWGYKL